MSLIFGNITEQFVQFQIVISSAAMGLPGFQEQIPEKAQKFRETAALDAMYLVLIGTHRLVLSI
jgi:ATP-binding cassette subfamily B (MDR/TAP) protein 1